MLVTCGTLPEAADILGRPLPPGHGGVEAVAIAVVDEMDRVIELGDSLCEICV